MTLFWQDYNSNVLNLIDYASNKSLFQVAVEYRLGVLGFLFLNINETPGNLGIRDQALALRMIKNEVTNKIFIY